MNNYEQLMQEASQGNKKAFKELYSYAGSGNAEAQYYLALYYKDTKGTGADSDYAYWMKRRRIMVMKQHKIAPFQNLLMWNQKRQKTIQNLMLH